MRISPINIFNTYKPDNSRNIHMTSPLKSGLKADCVTFRSVKNAEPLKELLKYHIPDMYTGVILVDPKDLEIILKKKLFSKPIGKIIKSMNNYVLSFLPVEKELFSIIKNIAKSHPKKTLENVIHGLYIEHHNKLLEKQRPIFEELNLLSEQMPEPQLQEFRELMSSADKKLSRKPTFNKFSTKEFRYKLDRISRSISARNIKSERKTMNRLIQLAGLLSDENKQKKFSRELVREQAEILRQMCSVLNNSALKDNKELIELFTNSRASIYKLPSIIPFNRKSFIYDLGKIVDKIPDKKLAQKMKTTAAKLPTAKESVSAFIVKEALNSSEKIGYDLLERSLGTIEHIKPSHFGGPSNINNYGLASSGANSERAHMSFDKFLVKHPEIYINCQNYIDRLIHLHEKGILEQKGLPTSYIYNFAKTVEKLSPLDNPLKLDLSRLEKQ